VRNYYDCKNAERRAAGDDWKDNGLIFITADGGPLDPRNLLRDFKRLMQNAGLPAIRFHDLRHTAASLMLNHEFPVLVVSRVLGHSRPSITLDMYGHLMPSIQSEIAERMDALLTPTELSGCSRLQHVAADFSPTIDINEPTSHI
jgi:integrase